MSCQSNGNKASLASIRCGISGASSRFAGTLASVQIGAGRAIRQADDASYAIASRLSPVTNATLGAINAGERFGAGNWARWGAEKLIWGIKAPLNLADKGVKLVGAASMPVGSAIGDLSRRELKSSTVQTTRFLNYFKKKSVVEAWSSGMTPVLNTGDLLTLGARRNVTKSEGVVIKVNGKSWHNGTTTVKTPAGERTINHLQSLTAPAQHTYFNRALSDKELAAVVGGMANPRTMPGFVGQISPTETLSPGWANAKRTLIKSQIFGHKTADAPAQHNLGPLTRVPNPIEAEKLARRGMDTFRVAQEAFTREVETTGARTVFGEEVKEADRVRRKAKEVFTGDGEVK